VLRSGQKLGGTKTASDQPPGPGPGAPPAVKTEPKDEVKAEDVKIKLE
jgi:hypothetical protein